MTGHRYRTIAAGWRCYTDGGLLDVEHYDPAAGAWEHVNTVRDEPAAVAFVRDRLKPAAESADTAETTTRRDTP